MRLAANRGSVLTKLVFLFAVAAAQCAAADTPFPAEASFLKGMMNARVDYELWFKCFNAVAQMITNVRLGSTFKRFSQLGTLWTRNALILSPHTILKRAEVLLLSGNHRTSAKREVRRSFCRNFG